MRRFFKKWLIWDLTETNWLNLLGTEYKIRFVIFIFTLSVPARLSLISVYEFQGTVTYYLLLDNRFRVSSGYLGAEFQETMVGL